MQAATWASHRSRGPFDTTALPFVWTSIIRRSASARGKPKSFWNTQVT